MKSIPWGVVAFVLALFVFFLWAGKKANEIVEPKDDPLPDDDGQWIPHEIKPMEPGPYRTRVYRKHNLESLNTRWTGHKWTYQDGEECYWQERDWRALPGRVES